LYDGPLPEYEINEAGIMVLCKACDKYLELLSTKEKGDSIISDERIMNKKVSELRKEPIIKIVNYLKENEEITTAKGIEITGKSEAQVRRYLKALCDLGIIKRTRTTKGNVYLKV
jgi:ATP-dependent DNA helicase RecG